ETGSYVGYAFAVPSNIARKVVEDIIEYGNVQRGILGIQVSSLTPEISKKFGIEETTGVFVGGIEKGSGADQAGIKEGDVIKSVDGMAIRTFADMSGYLGSKRPEDIVDVTLVRKGKERVVSVRLAKLETTTIADLGLEVKNL